MPVDVFISYATKDKLTADAVCGTLEARGIRCWIAPRDITPGQDWSDAIIDGLSAARVFVLLLSASSNISEQVKREIQNAVAEGLPVVPFRLEDVALSKHMRYFIGTRTGWMPSRRLWKRIWSGLLKPFIPCCEPLIKMRQITCFCSKKD